MAPLEWVGRARWDRTRLVCSALGAALLLAMSAPRADERCGDNTLRLSLAFQPVSLDPATAQDSPGIFITGHIFEPLLTYDYLASQPILIPNTAAALPAVSADGRTLTFTLKRGIFFADDVAFGGKPRELTAQDYVYTLQRIFDPKTRSPLLGTVNGKIDGMQERQQQAQATGRFDYDTPLPGLRALDRYTLQVRLAAPEPNFLYHLAWSFTGAVAREVVERYGDTLGMHPVGTGPYRLASWDRTRRLLLAVNPGYRDDRFDGTPAADDVLTNALLQQHRGAKLPRIACVEAIVIDEAQPRWLAFQRGDLDYVFPVPPDYVASAVQSGAPVARMARAGMRAQQRVVAVTTFTYFNMDDPVLGGYTPERVALRRALVHAYDVETEIVSVRKGQAISAVSPVSPGVAGYDPAFFTAATEYSPARAKALLDLYGYLDRDGDGWRELPDGAPLALEFGTSATAVGRALDEVWKRALDRIGVRASFRPYPMGDLIKLGRTGKLQAATTGWGTPYPDGEGFLLLLYGANKGNPNMARFALPEFDRLFEQARTLPDSPERTALYNRMNALAAAYAPWRPGVHLVWTSLEQPWLSGLNARTSVNSFLKFLALDVAERRARTGR